LLEVLHDFKELVTFKLVEFGVDSEASYVKKK